MSEEFKHTEYVDGTRLIFDRLYPGGSFGPLPDTYTALNQDQQSFVDAHVQYFCESAENHFLKLITEPQSPVPPDMVEQECETFRRLLQQRAEQLYLSAQPLRDEQ